MVSRAGDYVRQHHVALLCLFLLLAGGTAWALERNSVKSRHIVNGHVKPRDLGPVPSAKVRHTDHQAVENNTEVAVTFNTQERDRGGLYSASTPTRLTARMRGVYLISANISWSDPDVDGTRNLSLRTNGEEPFIAHENTVPTSGAINRYQAIATQAVLQKNDYVEVVATQNSGSQNSIFPNAHTGVPHFEMTWIAPVP